MVRWTQWLRHLGHRLAGMEKKKMGCAASRWTEVVRTTVVHPFRTQPPTVSKERRHGTLCWNAKYVASWRWPQLAPVMHLWHGLPRRAGQLHLMVGESGSVASVPCIRFDEVSTLTMNSHQTPITAFLTFCTSSTAQGGGGSFKNRKPIGEIGCCESRVAERIHWWTERRLELCFLEWLQWLQWSPGRSPHHNCWM